MDDLATILQSAEATRVFLAISTVFVLLYAIGFVSAASWLDVGDVWARGARRARLQRYGL